MFYFCSTFRLCVTSEKFPPLAAMMILSPTTRSETSLEVSVVVGFVSHMFTDFTSGIEVLGGFPKVISVNW